MSETWANFILRKYFGLLNIRGLLIGFIFFFAACNNMEVKKDVVVADDHSPATLDFKVINIFPHDTTAYTEGLLYHNGQLFESTGHTSTFPSSRSLFGVVNLKDGQIEIKAEIDKNKYFGEGIAFLKGQVFQLTDTTRIGFIYDAIHFKKRGQFYYDGEGWGLTTNGVYLMMSNGSSNIVFRDPVNLRIMKTLSIQDNNGPVQNLNELEMIHGFLYANQWLTNYILKIDTSTGRVVGRLDLTPLKKEAGLKYDLAQETNGIAYDSAADKILVTGKRWPNFYEIRFDH